MKRRNRCDESPENMPGNMPDGQRGPDPLYSKALLWALLALAFAQLAPLTAGILQIIELAQKP